MSLFHAAKAACWFGSGVAVFLMLGPTRNSRGATDLFTGSSDVGGPKRLGAVTFDASQGTIHVPSWSPDSRNLAFVSYQHWSEPRP